MFEWQVVALPEPRTPIRQGSQGSTSQLPSEQCYQEQTVIIFNPFCGCGTTIDAAEKLGRDWIGIDVTQLAISLIKNRLQDTYSHRLKFISGGASYTIPTSDPDGRAALPRRPADQQVSPAESIEMGSRTSTVRIIGEPTTPNKAATDETFKKAPESRKKLRAQKSLGL